ncbi:small subunit ribosomal protein S9 [Actinopolyspora xinjiangensis]|uniref:Small ribosomal subunit protein uS9 n=1 Tax=Actinopolyspora xinjiangensis TaxID=405564 RepID=A0A1H0Q4T9_9ACTN|nr:small subunit ribosomal protein S9 [Actinopolyspora xinjiangensis]
MTEGYEEEHVSTPETDEAPAPEVLDSEVPADEPAPEAFAQGVAPIPSSRPIQTVGRRKKAIVRVRLVPGSGRFVLNGKPMDEYMPNRVHQNIAREPMELVERTESFDVHVNLRGGGPSGQAGALRMALARALVAYQPEDRPALKKAGMLTRDPRAKERKKYGLKKARKSPQYSKR